MSMDFTITDNSPLAMMMKDAAVKAALEAIGQQAEGYAKGYAPVETHRLQDSISHAVVDDTVYIGTNVEYAVYQEMGTRKMKAHPFLTPAVQNHIGEYKQIAESHLKGGG